jgi:hypothetical protein
MRLIARRLRRAEMLLLWFGLLRSAHKYLCECLRSGVVARADDRYMVRVRMLALAAACSLCTSGGLPVCLV